MSVKGDNSTQGQHNWSRSWFEFLEKSHSRWLWIKVKNKHILLFQCSVRINEREAGIVTLCHDLWSWSQEEELYHWSHVAHVTTELLLITDQPWPPTNIINFHPDLTRPATTPLHSLLWWWSTWSWDNNTVGHTVLHPRPAPATCSTEQCHALVHGQDPMSQDNYLTGLTTLQTTLPS